MCGRLRTGAISHLEFIRVLMRKWGVNVVQLRPNYWREKNCKSKILRGRKIKLLCISTLGPVQLTQGHNSLHEAFLIAQWWARITGIPNTIFYQECDIELEITDAQGKLRCSIRALRCSFSRVYASNYLWASKALSPISIICLPTSMHQKLRLRLPVSTKRRSFY